MQTKFKIVMESLEFLRSLGMIFQFAFSILMRQYISPVVVAYINLLLSALLSHQ